MEIIAAEKVIQIIIPIVSAIIGGLIAIYPASIIENNRRKKERKIKATYNVLIPLYSEFENITKKYLTSENIKKENVIFYNIFKNLEEYLFFVNRIFLSEKILNNLKDIIAFIKKIDNDLENEYAMFIRNYRIFIIDQLDQFKYAERIEINFDSLIKTDLKLKILSKKQYSLIEYIESIEIVEYEEFEKKKSYTIKVGHSEREIYDAIGYFTDKEDLPEDTYELIRFFRNNIYEKEKEKNIELMSNTKTKENIEILKIMLKKIRKNIEDEIEIE